MPGYPRIDKGEGLIRAYELLQELRADIDRAYATLENDKESQYLRRCVVRAIFSYIEALIECIKVELRSTVRFHQFAEMLGDKEASKLTSSIGKLTEKDLETLGPIPVIGTANHGKFLPLDQNIKRTFRLAAKIWNLGDFRLTTDGEDFRDFLAAKNARNRLTHPRTLYDIEVTNDDMHCHTIAGMWAQSEFQRLFNARVRALTKDLSIEDRAAFLSHVEKLT
jgi:hypothetical protein